MATFTIKLCFKIIFKGHIHVTKCIYFSVEICHEYFLRTSTKLNLYFPNMFMNGFKTTYMSQLLDIFLSKYVENIFEGPQHMIIFTIRILCFKIILKGHINVISVKIFHEYFWRTSAYDNFYDQNMF